MNSFSNWLVSICLALCLSSCAWYYPKTYIEPADVQLLPKLEREYGSGQFFYLSTGLREVFESSNEKIEGVSKVAKREIEKSHVCELGYSFLEKTYTSYEYGTVGIFIKCNTNK